MKTKPKKTYLLHCFIAGLQYYNVLEIWKELKIGDIVDLLPEPENRFDHYAVMVAYNGKQLGYLPRSQNRHIAKILNAGLNPYKARIQSLYQDRPMYEQMEICLNIKPQEGDIWNKKTLTGYARDQKFFGF